MIGRIFLAVVGLLLTAGLALAHGGGGGGFVYVPIYVPPPLRRSSDGDTGTRGTECIRIGAVTHLIATLAGKIRGHEIRSREAWVGVRIT